METRLPCLEAASGDIEARRRTAQAYRLFADHVNAASKPDFTTRYGDGERFFAFHTGAAGIGDALHMRDILVLLGKRKRTAAGLSGATTTFSTPIRGCVAGIRLHCLDDLEFESVRPAVNSVAFRRLFRHEFLHLLDDKRSNNRIPDPPDPDDDRAGYLNHASEYNARYHDLADNLLSLAGEARSDPGSAADLADFYGFSGQFWHDLAAMAEQDRGTKDFMRWLNADRRRALLIRLFKLHQEVKGLIAAGAAKPGKR